MLTSVRITRFLSPFFIILVLLLGTNVNAQEGEALFQANCSSCHKLGAKLIGPNLVGVTERRPEEWLIKFIKNSQEVIKSGDEYAVNLYNEYNKVIMPPMALNDDEVKSILTYIEDYEKAEAASQEATASTAAAGGSGGSGDNTAFLGMSYQTGMVLLLTLVLVLAGIVFALFIIRKQLKKLVWKKENPDAEPPKSPLVEAFQNATAPLKELLQNFNPVIGVLTVIGVLVLFLAFDLYHRAQDLGTQIGYAPEQPVKFSHKLHAGQYQIDCQYCHTGVNKSKSANIPSTNICMNCHNYIQEGPQYGTEEIAKVRKSYEEDEPIKWVRIHNLPDHVYFNHAQHVNAGNLECQTCHGEIQEMEVVQQHAKLEMGWCINCHRETEVNLENGYYKETFETIKEHEKYTVSDMGGTQCARCHY